LKNVSYFVKKIKKNQKNLDFRNYIWYIRNTANILAGMIFENWAKCQFIWIS